MIRFCDVFFSLLGLIVLSPIFVIIALCIVLDSRGGVFYRQVRVGRDGKDFRLFKFRSMASGADKKGLITVGAKDSRVTRVGYFLRKYKLDELPQLLNILNGTMSIIGPRPVAQDQFDMFRYGKWNEAAKVPVGLSGPAALYDFIYGDQITDEKEYMVKVYPTRRELEYTYVQKAGIFYDLKMIVYTVICILYAVYGKECTWILNEFVEDAKKTMNK